MRHSYCWTSQQVAHILSLFFVFLCVLAPWREYILSLVPSHQYDPFFIWGHACVPKCEICVVNQSSVFCCTLKNAPATHNMNPLRLLRTLPFKLIPLNSGSSSYGIPSRFFASSRLCVKKFIAQTHLAKLMLPELRFIDFGFWSSDFGIK